MRTPSWRSYRLRLTALCRNSVFLRIMCELSSRVYLETGKNPYEQSSGTRPRLRNPHDRRISINHKYDLFIMKDKKLQTFEQQFCRGTTTISKGERRWKKNTAHFQDMWLDRQLNSPDTCPHLPDLPQQTILRGSGYKAGPNACSVILRGGFVTRQITYLDC